MKYSAIKQKLGIEPKPVTESKGHCNRKQHVFGKPVNYTTQKVVNNGEHLRTYTIFNYQCKVCGFVKQGDDLKYISPEQATQMLS